jgi:hypothetical protein
MSVGSDERACERTIDAARFANVPDERQRGGGVSAERARTVDKRILRRAAWRIGLQTACAVALASVAFAAAAVLVLVGAQHRDDGDQLRMAIAQADDVSDAPTGMWLAIREDDSETATPDLPAGLPDQRQIDLVAADRVPRSIDLHLDGREYEVRTVARRDGRVVQAMLDLSRARAERIGLVEAFAIVGLVGLPLAAAAGVWLAPRAVAPLADALTLQHRFVADASHELRTPLTRLSGRAQLIRRELDQQADPAVISSDVDDLRTDAAHLAEILDDLLIEPHPTRTDADEVIQLPALVTEALDAARPMAAEYDVELTCDVTGTPPPVAGSPPSLRRAVTALLDNAIRHATSEVTVTVAEEGRDVIVDVVDDGPAIAPEIMSTMFGRFPTSGSHADREIRRRYGLGIALASEVAAQHGGWVSALYTDRHGATLRLRLPAVRPTT